MRILQWNKLSAQEQAATLSRPDMLADAHIEQSVAEILDTIKRDGDAALRSYTKRFDGVDVADMKVPVTALQQAWEDLPSADKAAMQMAKANIETFHTAQIPGVIEVETMPGVVCRREPRPLDSAGLYVPGGSAPLVSTLMMLAIPAKIAGVEKRIVTTPPGADGKVNSAVLSAAYLCDIEDIYMVGGAQAIAAMGYGTKTIPKCTKIFGPGNAYVAEAKAQISARMGGPAIDLPAGPSEALVLADDLANSVFVAADLLAQAEHDPMAQVICVCRSQDFADAINAEIPRQLADLPRRDIASQALQNGRIIIADGVPTMVDIANLYAPEHLIVQIDNPDAITAKIRNAGSIFLGPWTPESVGDYASGTNHTLPTYGAARSYSGVMLESFMKFISMQKLSRAGLEALGPCVERLATLEGLEAHRRAVSLRLGTLL
ncbi:MAG: histidinol dehydrogenase [Robiginitomaculum sp.]|nr:MAG: histidinol dehydrogenase [Robiginitomaculum sp.]